MNTNLPCPYCSSSQGYIYVQSHYQCLTCKRVVDDCCGGEKMDCIIPVEKVKYLPLNNIILILTNLQN